MMSEFKYLPVKKMYFKILHGIYRMGMKTGRLKTSKLLSATLSFVELILYNKFNTEKSK